MNKLALTAVIVVLFKSYCLATEFALPDTFHAEQYLSNSEGLTAKVRIWKLGDQVRIQPDLPAAEGGYTLLNTTKKEITIIKPSTKQIATFPYAGLIGQASIIDESFLYFDKPITLNPIKENGKIVEYRLELPDRTLSFQFLDNSDPTTLKGIVFVKGEFWSAISWKFVSTSGINPDLFMIPNDYTSLIPK